MNDTRLEIQDLLAVSIIDLGLPGSDTYKTMKKLSSLHTSNNEGIEDNYDKHSHLTKEISRRHSSCWLTVMLRHHWANVSINSYHWGYEYSLFRARFCYFGLAPLSMLLLSLLGGIPFFNILLGHI